MLGAFRAGLEDTAMASLVRTTTVLCVILLLVAGSLACTATAHADTWLEQAEADLACTSLADGPERASLDAPLLPRPVAAGTLTAYLRGKPRNARQAKFRHLTTLAAIGWWADLVNDQVLRSDVYLTIGVLADRYAAADPNDLAFRQVARCARANLISTSLELGKPRDAELLADHLLRMYAAQPPTRPVEDWPLILALRELRLEPRARNGIAALATRAVEFAGAHARANQPDRASRLLAAAGQGLLALGEPQKAMQLAAQSMGVTGKPPAPDAAWRAMPILYDAAEKLNGARDAANVQALLRPDQPPATLRDKRTEFEALLRLSKAAETSEQYDAMGRLQLEAVRRLTQFRGDERYSMPFFRHALDDLAGTRDPNLGALAKRDPAFGARTLAAYTGTYDTLLRQAQDQFVGDAREQLHFQYKIDNSLHALTDLRPAMPRLAAQISDTTFQLAQLRSFGRLTLATLAAGLDRAGIDPQSRRARPLPMAKPFGRPSSRSTSSTRSRRDNTTATSPSSARKRRSWPNSRHRGRCRHVSSSADCELGRHSSPRWSRRATCMPGR